MAKAVADTIGENQAGFASDDPLVTGFSHMHDDGTGGVSRLATQSSHDMSNLYCSHPHWAISLSSPIQTAATTSTSANGNSPTAPSNGPKGPTRRVRAFSASTWTTASTLK